MAPAGIPSHIIDDGPETHYCYRCGKRVGGHIKNCYYCGAPTQRAIREARRCPYCDLPVRRKALKCQNCGEFLDGRPRAETPETAAQPQIIYNIDKAIISGPGGLAPQSGGVHAALSAQAGAGGPALPGGGGQGVVPGSPAAALPHQAPAMLEGPQPRALPQPTGAGGGETIDVKALPAPAARSDRADPATAAGGSRALVRSAGASLAPLGADDAPAPRQDYAPASRYDYAPAPASGVPSGQALAPASKPGWLSRWLPSRSGGAGARRPGRDYIDGEIAEEASPYRNCPKCSTEVLVEDNYCFHCGLALSKGAQKREVAKAPRQGTHAFLALSVVCLVALGALAYLRMTQGFPLLAVNAAAGFAALFGLIGVFAGKGLVSRLFSLAVAVVMGLYLALPWLPV